MIRYGCIAMALALMACGGGKATPEEAHEEDYTQFAALFPKQEPPYTLSDTALLHNKDTTQIRTAEFLAYIPDSVIEKTWGKKTKLHYTPLAKLQGAKKETYYVVRGTGGGKKAALILVADETTNFVSVLPFLVPDKDASTQQQSTVEKNLSIHRIATRKGENDVMQDGKDVFSYSNTNKRFELVMTDPLDEKAPELINPIDTLAKTHKFAGDYGPDKKNLISVRDGRKPGLLAVFIHIEKSGGACTGEIKGEAQLTGANTAVYRQNGDPCTLNLTFSKNSVTLQEEEGCGSRREQGCSFDGSYTKKKAPKPKTGKAKKS